MLYVLSPMLVHYYKVMNKQLLLIICHKFVRAVFAWPMAYNMKYESKIKGASNTCLDVKQK